MNSLKELAEQGQSIWRTLLVAAVVLLIVETALAGWRTRTGSREVVAT